jgi:hypothetical protein
MSYQPLIGAQAGRGDLLWIYANGVMCPAHANTQVRLEYFRGKGRKTFYLFWESRPEFQAWSRFRVHIDDCTFITEDNKDQYAELFI